MTLRLTKEQHEFVEKEAKEQNLSINQFLVKMIVDYKKHKNATYLPIYFNDAAEKEDLLKNATNKQTIKASGETYDEVKDQVIQQIASYLGSMVTKGMIEQDKESKK